MRATDWLWILFLGTIWGFSFPFNEILIRELDPLWVSAGRISVGAAASWLIVVALRKRIPTSWPLILGMFGLGIIAYAIPFALFPIAQQHMSGGVAAILNATTPIMTVLISHVFPSGERATWPKILGVIAGFFGVGILAVPALHGGGGAELWAIGVAILPALCYALALNLTRLFDRIDPSVLATIALSGAAVFASAAAFIFDGTPTITRPETWGALLGIGLLATALAFQIMYRILPRVGPTNFSVTTYIAPVSAIILGITFLSEVILPTHILGMAVIFTGVLLIDGRIARLLRRKPA